MCGCGGGVHLKGVGVGGHGFVGGGRSAFKGGGYWRAWVCGWGGRSAFKGGGCWRAWVSGCVGGVHLKGVGVGGHGCVGGGEECI